MNKEEMIKEFKSLYEVKGYISRNLIRHSKKCPSVGEYIKVFGDMRKVFELSDLDYTLNKKMTLNKFNLNEEDIFDELVRFNKEVGYPTIRALDNNKGYVSSSILLNVYWTIKNAICEAGIEIKDEMKNLYQRKEYTNEELISLLRDANRDRIDNNLPLMTSEEIDMSSNLPHSSTYIVKIGGLKEAYKFIGFDNYLDYNLHTSDEYFKKCYNDVKKIIERMPTSRDLDCYSAKGICPATSSYINHFGSLLEFQVSMGDKPLKWGKLLSDDELLKMLVDLSISLGITPTQNDVDDCEDLPSASTYCSRFGTFLNAITKAGLKARSERTPLITPKGNYALSGFEYKYMLMLEDYNIKFKKEALYRDYIEGYDRLHRFDFVVEFNNENYFIEIFGLQNKESYAEKTKYKIQLCEKNKLKLISIFPEDIRNKSIEQLYEFTLNKIKNLKE